MKGGEAHFLYVVKKHNYPFVPSCFSVLKFGLILQNVGALSSAAAMEGSLIVAPILGDASVALLVVVVLFRVPQPCVGFVALVSVTSSSSRFFCSKVYRYWDLIVFCSYSLLKSYLRDLFVANSFSSKVNCFDVVLCTWYFEHIFLNNEFLAEIIGNKFSL